MTCLHSCLHFCLCVTWWPTPMRVGQVLCLVPKSGCLPLHFTRLPALVAKKRPEHPPLCCCAPMTSCGASQRHKKTCGETHRQRGEVTNDVSETEGGSQICPVLPAHQRLSKSGLCQKRSMSWPFGAFVLRVEEAFAGCRTMSGPGVGDTPGDPRSPVGMTCVISRNGVLGSPARAGPCFSLLRCCWGPNARDTSAQKQRPKNCAAANAGSQGAVQCDAS